MLDINYLKEWLSYDPETGVFTWLKYRRNIKKGDVAGCINQKGYLYIGLQGKLYRANRLAWFYVHGVMPTGQIDHIDGDRINNRIANLRDVDGFTNQQNRKNGNKNASSKYLGVSFHKQSKKWIAQIWFRQHKYIGLYDTEEEAHQAYLAEKSALARRQKETING